MPPLDDVVVVGASAAGLAAADALRDGGFDGSITILDEERRPPYDRRALSKQALAAAADEAPALRSADQFEANRLEFRPGHAAAGLDIDRRYVVTNYGDALRFDAVVLACGSRARQWHTVDGEPLTTLRTADDVRLLREAAARYGEVTIIGAGFVGLELAAGLARQGVAVRVFEARSLPLDDVVGPEVAAALERLHRTHGVDLRSGVAVREVTGAPGAYALRLDDGSVHQAKFVLAAVGSEPDVRWLEGSGVGLDAGVLSDAAGRTNVAGVWTAGDVALFNHPVLGEAVRIDHWAHAVDQGRRVGLNIAGGEAVPYAALPSFSIEQFELRVHCYGRREPGDEILVAEGSLQDGEFVVLHGNRDELHAALWCGPDLATDYRELLDRRATWQEACDLARATTSSTG